MKIGIIVDGHGDFAAFKSRFTTGFKILKTDGPRGHTVPISQIATRSRKQVVMLMALRCTHIVIVTDFEARADVYSEFREKLASALGTLDASLFIGCAVPNRMIENWYLSDIAYLATQKIFLRPNVQQRSYEGTNGKADLKSLLLPRYSYDEVDHGAQLFSILRFDEARQNSESFDHFLGVLRQCGASV